MVRLEQLLVSGLFGVYIAGSEIRNQKSKLYLPLTLSICGICLLATAQFINSGTLGFWIFGERTFSLSTPGIAKFDFYGREFLRPYATFPHPNVLAGFILIILLILPISKWRVALGGFTILLTVSRVAMFTGLISVLLLGKKRAKIFIILLVLALLPILFTRFSSLINYDNLTFVRRVELSKVALTLWSKSPIFGVGLNNFIPAGSDLLLSGPSRFLQPVHNIFLLALSETGIFGLLGLMFLIGYPIYKKKFLLVWGEIIFLGMFDHYFLTLPQGYRLLFFVWGLSLSKIR